MKHLVPVGPGQSASGSLEVRLSSLEPLFAAADVARLFTVRTTWRAPWWKRPLLWALRRPTYWTTTVHDAHLAMLSVSEDGSLLAAFEALPR